MDLVIKLVGWVLFIMAVRDSYFAFKKDKSLLKLYFSNYLDYLWGFLLSMSVLMSILFILYLEPPAWLKFSWISFISDGQSQNLVTSPMTSGFTPIVIIFWILMVLCFPYLAKMEEVVFRHDVIDIKARIKKSIIFGLVHMLMGIPLYIALVLSVVGFIFSIRYVRSWRLFGSEVALIHSTSLHMKYNFILITIGCLLVLFT